jgi:hypothetical protein
VTLPGSPLDHLAVEAIQGAQLRLGLISPRPTLTDVEKREAGELVRDGQTCRFCAGLHVGASGPACPRLAAGKLNGDGDVVEFTFWPDGKWSTDRVVFVADVADETGETTETAGEGG